MPIKLFTKHRLLTTVIPILLFSATLAGNWSGLLHFVRRTVADASQWSGRPFRGNGEHTDAPRELAERFISSGATLYYCPITADGTLQPADRSVHLALSWALSPRPVRFGNKEDVGNSDAIIASRYLTHGFSGYSCVATNQEAALWRRGEANLSKPEPREASQVLPAWREAIGLTFVCLLLLGIVNWAQTKCCADVQSSVAPNTKPPIATINRVSLLVVSLFFIGLTIATLTHTFLAPTGLGVYGGKAKLLYLSSGVPHNFFTDPAFSSYQPAYPPALAILTLLAYYIAGGCGEWLTQLIPAFAMALVLWLTIGKSGKAAWVWLWIVAAFTSKHVMQMATFYYAEPLAALCVVSGWLFLRQKKGDWRGVILLGMSGLFKNEGLIYLLAVWLAFGIRALPGICKDKSGFVKTTSGIFKWLGCFVVAASLPLAWHVVCRLAGATLYDYAPIWHPEKSKFLMALWHLLKTAFLQPWNYGFAYPLAVLIIVVVFWQYHRGRFHRSMIERHPLANIFVAALVPVICLPIFAVIYSFSCAPSFSWHLKSSAVRLLWVPSLPLLAEICRWHPNNTKK